jgi:hypothetical protein
MRDSTLILLDGHRLDTISRLSYPYGPQIDQENFIGSDYFWGLQKRRGSELIEIFNSKTGARCHKFLINTLAPYRDAIYQFSDDAEFMASLDYQPRSGASGARSVTLELRGTSNGALLASRGCLTAWPVAWFPHSHHLLAGHDSTPYPAIIDAAHEQPLAILATPLGASIVPAPVIAPNGHTILTGADPLGRSLAIFRPTGRDCPESHLGALVFPQTWLTIVLFAALCVSLTRDARRARPASVHRPPSSFVATGLLLIAIVLTFHFLLTAALGRWTLTPAPLLLVAAIGLATHSRAWRAITLWLLAGMLPLSLLLAYRLYRSGVWSASVWPVLDRYYSIPHLAPFVALCAAGVLLPIGIFFLSRPRTLGV